MRESLGVGGVMNNPFSFCSSSKYYFIGGCGLFNCNCWVIFALFIFGVKIRIIRNELPENRTFLGRELLQAEEKVRFCRFSKWEFSQRSSSFSRKGRILQGPILLGITSAVPNDDIRAVSKPLDAEKVWGRCEENGHCSDRCLQKMLESYVSLCWLFFQSFLSQG